MKPALKTGTPPLIGISMVFFFAPQWSLVTQTRKTINFESGGVAGGSGPHRG
jgi:hypothetical protein